MFNFMQIHSAPVEGLEGHGAGKRRHRGAIQVNPRPTGVYGEEGDTTGLARF